MAEDEIDPDECPRSIAEMTRDAQEAYQLDYYIYINRLRRYNIQSNAIKDLKNWVLETADMHLIRTACHPTESVRQWYILLKKQVGVDDVDQQRDTRERYGAVLKPFNN